MDGLVGEIVERGMDHTTTSSTASVGLRPIQAVVGQAFPVPQKTRVYRRRVAGAASSSSTAPRTATAISGTSAHVQPDDPQQRPPDGAAGALGSAYVLPRDGQTPVMRVGTSTQDEPKQWSVGDFTRLFRGHYHSPLPSAEELSYVRLVVADVGPGAETAKTTEEDRPTGEDFFDALVHCLHSRVRRHQDLAVMALYVHLCHDATGALAERCIHGPDCAPFMFQLIQLLASAGHPVRAHTVALCLVLLGTAIGATPASAAPAAGDTLESLAGEMGCPAADAVEEMPSEETPLVGVGGLRAEQNLDLPFAELSEMMRGPDAIYALDKMGYTAVVVGAMGVVLQPPTEKEAGQSGTTTVPPACYAQLLARLLLCGGVGVSSPSICVALTQVDAWMEWAESELTSLVLGERRLVEVVDLLQLLRRLLHVPAAQKRFLRGSTRRYETMELVVAYLCTYRVEEVQEVREVVAITSGMLLLRELVRLGHGVSLLRDASDTVLGDGLKVGAALALEFYALHLGATRQRSSDKVDDGLHDRSTLMFLQDAARVAVRECSSESPSSSTVLPPPASPASAEAELAQSLLHQVARLANTHFLATYLRVFATFPNGSLSLAGTAVDTQHVLQKMLSRAVLTPDALATSFRRLRVASQPALPPSISLLLEATALRQVARSVGLVSNTTKVAATTNDDDDDDGGSSTSRGVWDQLSVSSAQLHANLRLASSVASVCLAVPREPICGYAAALASAFDDACLGIRDDVPRRLQSDELCSMVEVLGLLELGGAAGKTTKEEDEANPCREVSGASYTRQLQLSSVFLLHGMAMTKQCLDASPRVLAGLMRAMGEAPPSATLDELVELLSAENPTGPFMWGQSLLRGVAMAVPSGPTPARGLPASWALQPLLDEEVVEKTGWARWLTRCLGLHARVKHVWGWEGILSHVLLWSVAHRSSASMQAAQCALGDLLVALGHMLMEQGSFSAAASETLGIPLASAAAAHTEEALPLTSFAVLCLVACHAQPATSLAALEVLLQTPLVEPRTTATETALPSSMLVCQHLLQWGRTGEARRPGSASTPISMDSAPSWSLDEIVQLLQLMAPCVHRHDGLAPTVPPQESSLPRDDEPASAAAPLPCSAETMIWAAASGVLRRYLHLRFAKRGVCHLSLMERQVLRETLEELSIFPTFLWSVVQP